jgi:hypothetical protein
MTNNDLNSIREKLQELFDLEGVKQIVCVDDHYREFKDELIVDIIGELEKHDINNLHRLSNEIEELKPIVWENEDTWKNQIQRIWNSSIDSERKSLVNRINNVIPISTDTSLTEIEIFESLSSIIGSLVELKELSYRQWKDSYGPYGENFKEEDSSKRTIFLFDQNLSEEEGGEENGGIKIIEKLLRNGNNSIMCGLFSHTFTQQEEYKKWEDFARDYEIDKNRFILISKKNLTEDKPGFVRRLRLTILSKYCKILKDKTSGILENSFEESKKKIDELNIYDFEKIVFHSSLLEGIWEPDTLFRLYNIYHKHHIYRNLIGTQDIFSTTDKIRKISGIGIKDIGRNDSDPEKLWEISRLELYEEGDQINKLHRPIELGDIFLLNKGNFILLAQPCNLMVRTSKPKGERANNVREVILAEIRKENKPENSSFYSDLKYFVENTDEIWYVDFRKACSVLLCILDLCVFNPDGIARISTDDICPSSTLPAWNYRFGKLKKKFDEIIAEYNGYTDKKYDKDFLEKYLLPKSPASGRVLLKPQLKSDPQKQKYTIEYNCKRVKRLCKQHAEDILLKYSHYISRSAFEHDLGKEENNQKA